jgi:hypothetical protein
MEIVRESLDAVLAKVKFSVILDRFTHDSPGFGTTLGGATPIVMEQTPPGGASTREEDRPRLCTCIFWLSFMVL